MSFRLFWTLITCCFVDVTELRAQPPPAPAQLKVFLDCQSDCFADYLRTELTFVDFVRDRTEAEVHVLITSAETGGGGREYTVAFIGEGTFKGTDHTLKALTTQSDTEDVVRRQLDDVAADRPAELRRDARRAAAARRHRPARDRGAAPGGRGRPLEQLGLQPARVGLARQRGVQPSGAARRAVSADRITPDWKITIGGELDYETEEFDLDEDEPVKVDRREREFRSLVVKWLGEHWSVGVGRRDRLVDLREHQFSVGGAPAVEFNVFPVLALHAAPASCAVRESASEHVRYYEETLYGKLEETLPLHELDVTYEQREQWGSLQARPEGSQYLHDLSKSRLEADGEVSVRLARGLSVSAEVNGSRIRDQLSLPAAVRRRGNSAAAAGAPERLRVQLLRSA